MSAALVCGAPALREVRLYGHLRARFGRSHWLAVDTAAEAVQALCALLKGFRGAFLGRPAPGETGPAYRVVLGEGDGATVCDEEMVHLRAGRAGVIRICPVVVGAKSGWAAIVIGAALMIVAPYASGFIFSAMGGVAGGTAAALATTVVYGGMMAIGKAMILGGIVQLVSPQRNNNGSSVERETSYTLAAGGANVVAPGGPVNLIIGRMVVGSSVVSQGIRTDDVKVVASPAPPAPDLPFSERRNPRDEYYEHGD